MADQKYILIADDEDDIAHVLGQILKVKGFEVDRAEDGQVALAKIRERAPDLLVLDVMMPNVNGYEVCRTLKEDENLKSIPIIMLTAKAQQSDIFWGQEMGADQYITKPFETQEVVDAVNALLGG